MMSGQDFDALQTFALVVELGSFTAASVARNVSQPAISMQVRQLETRLGLKLVERAGRNTQPTPAGRELLDHVRRLRLAAEDAWGALAPYRDGTAGRIRIGTGATACIYVLPSILRLLRERMPGLEIVVETGNSPEILRLVEDNALDLGLVTLPASGRSLEVMPVLDDELVAIFAPGRFARGATVTPAMLAAQPLALYEPGGQTRRLIAGWFEAAGIRPRPIMQLGSIEAIKNLVAAGICCSIIPQMALAGSADTIVSVPLSPPHRRTLGIAIRRDRRLDRGLREMLAFLRALPDEKGRPHGTGLSTTR